MTPSRREFLTLLGATAIAGNPPWRLRSVGAKARSLEGFTRNIPPKERILGGLILMPLFLGMPPLAPLQMEPMRPVAMGSLVGHLIYGVILGGGFAMLKRGIPGLTRHA